MQVMFNRLLDPMSHKFWVATLLFTCLSIANAQPRALLEACNAVDDKAKRMECLEQLMQLQGTTSSSPQATTLKRAKSAFAAIASTVQSGVSFNNYSVLIMDPAKELGVLRQEAPTLDPLVFEKLQAAVAAYNDAASVWRASIYQSQDGGFIGRVLNPERTGLMPIVNKYGLYTTTVLFNTHLPADAAVGKIWRYAEMTATEAFDIAEGTPRPKLEPAGALPTVASPPSTEEESTVERSARDSGCNTHPVAAKTGVKDGQTEYAVYCSKGNTQIYRCSSGSCTTR